MIIERFTRWFVMKVKGNPPLFCNTQLWLISCHIVCGLDAFSTQQMTKLSIITTSSVVYFCIIYNFSNTIPMKCTNYGGLKVNRKRFLLVPAYIRLWHVSIIHAIRVLLGIRQKKIFTISRYKSI